MDQREPENSLHITENSLYSLHITVDTPPELDVHKTFLSRLGHHINMLCTFV